MPLGRILNDITSAVSMTRTLSVITPGTMKETDNKIFVLISRTKSVHGALKVCFLITRLRPAEFFNYSL